MNWIRVATGIKNDPRLAAMAEQLGTTIAHAVGLVVSTLCELPEHAKQGDVSAVPNLALERWAGWEGERDAYAFAFRTHMCTDAGVVSGWERHNGAAIRESDASRERARQWRDERRKKRDRTDANEERTANERVPNGLRTENERVAYGSRTPLRDGTGRDGNKEQQQTAKAPRPRAAAKGEGKYPHFPMALSDAGHNTWLAKFGATDYGTFRKAFAPIFNIPEADRPPTLPRDAEFTRIVELYAIAIRGTRSAQFAKPDACAGKAAQLATAVREEDSERRIFLARMAMGTVEEQRRLEMAA